MKQSCWAAGLLKYFLVQAKPLFIVIDGIWMVSRGKHKEKNIISVYISSLNAIKTNRNVTKVTNMIVTFLPFIYLKIMIYRVLVAFPFTGCSAHQTSCPGCHAQMWVG